MKDLPKADEMLKMLGMDDAEMAKFAEGARFLFSNPAPAKPDTEEPPPAEPILRARR